MSSEVQEQSAGYNLADLEPVLEKASNNHALLDSLPIWLSAQTTKSAGRGRSADNTHQYSVQKLRELILELAVRGKLVEQDQNDEPASVLLEKITEGKAQLIKEGKIRKSKPLPSITPEERIDDIPGNWSVCRLNDIGTWGSGATPKRGVSDYYGGGIPWFKSGELSKDFINSSEETITEKALKESSVKLNSPGDVLIAMYGATIGKASILEVEATTNQAVCACSPFDGVSNLFLLLLLKAYKARFIGMGAGGAQPNISREKIIATVIALPPLAEQHRIVKKVDELMALCDQLEQQQADAVQAHDTLVSVLLDTLTQSDNADDFRQNWRRIAEHFDTLFTTESSIDQLKQTILQLAVMGKLVPQDPKDEPASVLLKKIAEEKARLIKEGKIKKQKPLPDISADEAINLLPTSWQNIRMDDLCYGITSGSTPPKSEFTDTGIPYLKVYNIREQKIDFDYQPQFVDEGYHKTKLKRSILYPGDVVMNIVGPPLGKTAIIPSTYPEWNCNQAIVFFRPLVNELSAYLHLFLKSGIFLDSIELIGTAGQDNISVTKSRSIVIGLPPLNEQHRIVKKVDELMTLCDQLKARLSQAQTLQQQLADAVVAEAVG